MSLDIYIGRTKKESLNSNRELFFPEDLHEYIFNRYSLEKKYNFFYRLNDYYRDIIYHKEEIHQLRKELIELSYNSNLPLLKDFFLAFSKVCMKAEENNLKIFCFCD